MPPDPDLCLFFRLTIVPTFVSMRGLRSSPSLLSLTLSPTWNWCICSGSSYGINRHLALSIARFGSLTHPAGSGGLDKVERDHTDAGTALISDRNGTMLPDQVRSHFAQRLRKPDGFNVSDHFVDQFMRSVIGNQVAINKLKMILSHRH